MQELGKRVARLTLDDLTAAARDRMALCLLANWTVGIAGPKYSAVPAPKGAGPYRLLNGETSASMHAAAFYNAATMHARTQDDFDSGGNLHPGTVIVPALSALTDGQGISGKDFLEAIAAGYMVAVSFSRLCSPDTTPRGLRSTGLYCPFGATAAIGRAQRRSAEHINSALSLTTVFVGGTTQAWLDGSHEWQIHPAHAARTGFYADELAADGVKGGAHALDGKFGFFAAYFGKPILFEQLEKALDPSVILQEASIKRYPVSGICQSVVLGCERAAKRAAGQKIKRVRVVMNSFEMRYPGNQNRGPFVGFGDKLMSAAFCSSSVLAHGKFVFDDFHTGPHAERDRLISVNEVADDPNMPLLSCDVVLETEGGTIEEKVRDSRAQVAIDWKSVDDWATAIWQEAGKPKSSYERCRDAVRGLEKAPRAQIPM